MSSFDRARQTFSPSAGKVGSLYSLPQLEKEGLGRLSRLPASLRVVLESLVRNCDGKRVKEDDVRALAAWEPRGERTAEIPFVVARIVLQDFTGVPLLVDLAAMRSAVDRLRQDPRIIEPLVPVDLVVDHSVQVDEWSLPDALRINMEIEFRRNRARYEFLKWGSRRSRASTSSRRASASCTRSTSSIWPAACCERDGVYYPDTLVGTDSHTTMINGLGVVGWGVGGIEAEAGMLGQPVYFLTPDVVGVHMHGRLADGVTATDLVLAVTEMLRKAKVVGKFVEFFGEGAASLSVTDRATIANMAPEYGATMGFFPVDEESCRYFSRPAARPSRSTPSAPTTRRRGCSASRAPASATTPRSSSSTWPECEPSVAGPKRPQDRIDLPDMKSPLPRALLEARLRERLRQARRRRCPSASSRPSARAARAGGGSQHPPSVSGALARDTNV